MIRVAFNNIVLHPGAEDGRKYMSRGLDGYIEAAHDLGFAAFQAQAGGVAFLGIPESFGKQDVRRIRETLEARGMEMHLHHHGVDCNPDVFEFARKGPVYHRFRNYLKAAISFLRDTGGTVLTFHVPFADAAVKPYEVPIDPESRRQCIRAYGELMRELGVLAEKVDVKLGIESAVWGPPRGPWTGPFLTPEELDEFVRSPGMPESVGILAEISHLHHMSYDIPALIRMWGSKVYDVHTSDAIKHRWSDKKNYNEVLVPETHHVIGQGTIDFRGAIGALHEIGYDGTLSLEIFAQHIESLADSIASREILERIIAQVSAPTG